MLMRLRSCLHRDIRFDSDDIVAIDEVYIGATWSYKPSFKKFKEATPPPAHWNLNQRDTKAYYKKQFMELAAQDKMPVLGLVSLKTPKISLVYIPTSERQEFVRSELSYRLGQTMSKMFVDSPQTIVTDQSGLYKFLDELLDHNNRKKFDHQVCRHDQNKYASSGGQSSNRLEAAFSHIKRSWRGVYTRWSRLYNQLYLDEFCYRYCHPLSSKTVIMDRITEFFSRIDWRAVPSV
jgi:hypothetical protein